MHTMPTAHSGNPARHHWHCQPPSAHAAPWTPSQPTHSSLARPARASSPRRRHRPSPRLRNLRPSPPAPIGRQERRLQHLSAAPSPSPMARHSSPDVPPAGRTLAATRVHSTRPPACTRPNLRLAAHHPPCLGAIPTPLRLLIRSIAPRGLHMADPIRFDVKFVPAGTGSVVWDDPHADRVIQRFMPPERQHGPMLGILHIGAVRPTPAVLRKLVVAVGEDIKVGRYGDFSFFICSEDEDTRSVIGDIAVSKNVSMFVCSSSSDLKHAEPVGALTAKDHETLRLVSEAGGTVAAADFANQVGIEKTAAGNRLVSLQKKGYLQRVERPHPAGDLFVDPRSVRMGS